MLLKEPFPANSSTSSRALQQHIFSLLKSCNTIEKLSQIHTQVITNGLSQKNYILVKILSFYITIGKILNAHKVFEKMEAPSVTLWNQMIRGHGRSRTPQKSVEFYKEMLVKESQPDEFSYSYLLSACAANGLFREGEQVHSRVFANGYCSNVFVRTNLVNLYAMRGDGRGIGCARKVFDEMCERSIVSWNSLLKGYIKCGDIDEARKVFDEMPERNVVSWTTVISGCTQQGKCKQALSLFNEMRRAKTRVKLDQVVLVAALTACAELGDLKLGKWIHLYVQEKLCNENEPILVSLNNALIHMYASCGEIEEAYEVFRKMEKRSTVSWTSIITGFAKQGYAQEAIVIFEWMISLGEKEAKPDAITFLGVLSACSHAGFVEKGCHFFDCMKQSWGIEPKIEHYGCMIDLLSRAAYFEEAVNLIRTMPLKPNDLVWGALLGGCRIHNNVEVASHVAQKLVAELDPNDAAGYLVLLANIYANAKRWGDVTAVRQMMIKMGVRKPPGRSSVQINGVVHDFISGDGTHRHASSVYKMLSNLTSQAKLEGYEPDMLQLFNDFEE